MSHLKQYHWIMQDGHGCAWDQSVRDWTHDQGAKHIGLTGHYAKGVMHIVGASATVAVQTPGLLNDIDTHQLAMCAELVAGQQVRIRTMYVRAS